MSLAVTSGLITCAQPPNASNFAPIKYKPLIVTGLDTVMHAMENQQVSLSICVKGTPPFTYSWYKNDVIIGTATNDTFINIGNAQFSHAGRYKVIVKNDNGADTSSGELIVDSLFYKIAVSKSGKGTVSPIDTSGFIKVRPGATPTFTYAPDSGSYVDSVKIGGVEFSSAKTAPSFTFPPINQDNSFRVVFSGTKYTLTVTPPVNGMILPTYTSKTFDYNDTATLTAVPNSGFYFGGWGSDGSGTDPILHIVMKSNKTVSANFTDTNKFSLTVASPNGRVELNPPGGSYSRDAVVQLMANASAGYRFLSWGDSAAASGSTNPTNITMNSKKVVKANFIPLTYQLTVTASSGGTITTPANSPASVDSGIAQVILATAINGYSFVKWDTISGTPTIAAGTNRSTTVTLINGNTEIRAVFAANGYTLTIQKNNPLDTTYPSGSTNVIHGVSTDILVKPYRGTHFSGWTTVSGAATFDDSLLAGTKVTLTSGNATIKAKTGNDTFTLTLTKDSGTVAQLPISQTTFVYGDTIRLTATPKTGYHFTGWSGDTAIADTLITSIKVTFTKSRVVHAGFAKIGNFAVNVTSVGGTFAKNPSLSSYEYNDRVLLTASPDSAHTFTNWTGDIATTSANPCTVMVTATKNITANYAIKKFAVTIDNGGHGTTTPAVLDSITLNTPKSITVIEVSGYRFINWTVTPANAATIQNPTSKTNATVTLVAAQPIMVTANYIPQYTLNVNVDPSPMGGTVYPSLVTVDSLSNVAISCTSKAGYAFKSWESTSGTVNFVNSTSIATTVTALSNNATIRANFDRVYTVTYNGNGSDGGVAPLDTTKYKVGTTVTISNSAGTLSKSGNVFAGWSLTQNGSVLTSFAMGTTDTVIYAKWVANRIVTFDDRGADLARVLPSLKTIKFPDSTLGSLPTPPRKTGYTFSGWGKDTAGPVNAFDNTVFLTNDTLFAIYSRNTYYLIYDANGATSAPTSIPPPSFYQQIIAVGSYKDFQRTYYQCSGWNTMPDGSGVTYDSGSIVIMPASDLRLYAKWAALKDADNNVYTTVKIGTQVWMVENLKTTKYRDGTPLFNDTSTSHWGTIASQNDSMKYCWYNNDTNNKTSYGALYNWYAVTNFHKIAPLGWHVPTDSEWTVLSNYLGGENTAGGKMKEAGTTHWASPNANATNSTGFSALPGGYRYYDGTFSYQSSNGYWWSAEVFGASSAWGRVLGNYGEFLGRFSENKRCGFSVRLLRD